MNTVKHFMETAIYGLAYSVGFVGGIVYEVGQVTKEGVLSLWDKVNNKE